MKLICRQTADGSTARNDLQTNVMSVLALKIPVARFVVSGQDQVAKLCALQSSSDAIVLPQSTAPNTTPDTEKMTRRKVGGEIRSNFRLQENVLGKIGLAIKEIDQPHMVRETFIVLTGLAMRRRAAQR